MITFKEYINEGSLVNKLAIAAAGLGVFTGGAVQGLNNNWLKNFTHHYNENMSFENVQ